MINKLKRASNDDPVNPWIIALVVSIATFMEVLDTTITNVSLSHIAGTLSATQEESTWILTSYLVSNGIVLPLSGWLSDVMGRKKFFLTCIAGFTLASFACGAANSMAVLVFFRLIQGLAGGGLQPTQQAIILDAFPPQKRGMVFGVTGITLIVAPILGPTLGGWITDNYSWRWIFFINIPVGAITFLLVSQLVKDSEHSHAKKTGSVDYIGLGLIALGLGAMQVVLDKGQLDDWFESNFIVITFSISLISICLAIIWLLKQKNPIIDLRLMTDKAFGLGSILIFITGFVLYSSSMLLPLLVQTQFGYDATLAGLVLSPGGLLLLFLMPISGKLVSKVQARYLIAFGLLLCATGTYMTSFVTPQTNYRTFVFMRSLQVLGLPFLFIPTSALAFMNIQGAKNNKASALFSLSRNLGGSIGIATIASYVTRHQQIHQSYISVHLSNFNETYRSKLSQITQSMIQHGMGKIEAAKTATGQLYHEMLSQASVLAYMDAFRLMAGMMIFAIIITALLPANKPNAKKAVAAH